MSEGWIDFDESSAKDVVRMMVTPGIGIGPDEDLYNACIIVDKGSGDITTLLVETAETMSEAKVLLEKYVLNCIFKGEE